MPQPSLAQRLPFDVLLQIFRTVQSLALEERGEYLHGTETIGWDSHEESAPFALVCRSWEEAAVAVLYQSVVLAGGDAARSFSTTLRARPELVGLVRYIALGLAEEDEFEEGGEPREEWPAASVSLMEVLELLSPTLEHLLLRPLDPSLRPRVLAFLFASRLITYAAVARASDSSPPWSALADHKDAAMLPSTLQRFSVDVWDAEPPSGVATTFPHVPHLERIVYSTNYPIPFIYGFIAHAPTITSLHLYFETLQPARESAQALISAPHLRHLIFFNNPSYDDAEVDYDAFMAANPIPALDLALPSLMVLETLAVSSTDLTSSFLSLLPPNLHSIKIRAYNSHGFERPERMLEMLQDPKVDLRSLREIEVQDVSERWDEVLREKIAEACERRGVRFVWVSDDVMEEEEERFEEMETSEGEEDDEDDEEDSEMEE